MTGHWLEIPNSHKHVEIAQFTMDVGGISGVPISWAIGRHYASLLSEHAFENSSSPDPAGGSRSGSGNCQRQPIGKWGWYALTISANHPVAPQTPKAGG